MSTFLNSVIVQALKTRIEELREENANNHQAVQNNTASMTDQCERLAQIDEDIVALGRARKDALDTIDFLKGTNANLAWKSREAGNLLRELNAELSARTEDTTPAPATPVSRRAGKLKVSDEEMIRKQFSPLLKTKGDARHQYVRAMREEGYPFHDTAISLALGKYDQWLSQLVSQAKKAGYKIPRNNGM